MKPKVAIYARFSTDMQDAASLDGQIRNCEEFCKRSGYRVVARYTDKGITGTADQDRPGFSKILAAAERSEIEGIVVDETSRLTRTPWKLGQLIEQLQFRGQFVCDAKGSFDSRNNNAQLLAGLYGGLDSLELQKIKERTHRGLRERAQHGYWTGGKVYGYRSEPVDTSDPKTRSRLIVDHEQAEVVRWIYEAYASGMSPKKIADDLNRRAVPSPGSSWNRKTRRANGWMHSALVGCRDRGSGILRNEIYTGRVVWNKRQFVKVPGTRKRVSRIRPKEQWTVHDHPELQIVDQDLWERVQRRLERRRTPKKKLRRGAPGKYVLSGLLKCGDCGANFIIADRHHYRCSSHTNGGQRLCGNGLKVRRDLAERIILVGIQNDLLSPDSLEYARQKAEKLLAQARRRQQLESRQESELQLRLAETEEKLRRVSDAIETVGISETLADRLKVLEEDRIQLQRAINALPEVDSLIPDEIPDFGARWRNLVADIAHLRGKDTAAAREALRGLLGRITLHREGDHLEAELTLEPKRLALMASPSGSQINNENLVAGAGFEPATFGL